VSIETGAREINQNDRKQAEKATRPQTPLTRPYGEEDVAAPANRMRTEADAKRRAKRGAQATA